MDKLTERIMQRILRFISRHIYYIGTTKEELFFRDVIEVAVMLFLLGVVGTFLFFLPYLTNDLIINN